MLACKMEAICGQNQLIPVNSGDQWLLSGRSKNKQRANSDTLVCNADRLDSADLLKERSAGGSLLAVSALNFLTQSPDWIPI